LSEGDVWLPKLFRQTVLEAFRCLGIPFSGCMCMHPSVCDHVLKVGEHDTSRSCGNFTKFTTEVH